MRKAVSPRITVALVAALVVLVGAIGYFTVIRPGKQGAQQNQKEMRSSMQQAYRYMQQSAQQERAARRNRRKARRQSSRAEDSAAGWSP